MERDTFIRWLCLVEIVQLAEEKAKDLKVDLDNVDWVKPLDFKKYMNERFKSMEIDLMADEKNGHMLLEYVNNTHHIPEYC
jgi:disulfide oxidoreductase YuzD